jgi:hypothetical protein
MLATANRSDSLFPFSQMLHVEHSGLKANPEEAELMFHVEHSILLLRKEKISTPPTRDPTP